MSRVLPFSFFGVLVNFLPEDSFSFGLLPSDIDAEYVSITYKVY